MLLGRETTKKRLRIYDHRARRHQRRLQLNRCSPYKRRNENVANGTEKSHYSFFTFMGMDLKAVFGDISFRKLGGTDESGVAEIIACQATYTYFPDKYFPDKYFPDITLSNPHSSSCR